MKDSHTEALARTGIEETPEFADYDPDDPEFQREYNRFLKEPLTDDQIDEILRDLFEVIEGADHERIVR